MTRLSLHFFLQNDMLRTSNKSLLMENPTYNRISVLRAERKLSRQDFADALGVNYQTIGFLERGDYNPSLSLALDISAYFGLPVEAVFSRKPFKPLSHQVYGMPSAPRKAGSR